MPGGGEAVPDPKKFSDPRTGNEIFWPSRGSGGMLPWKIFKIKGPRLAKNAFTEISARKIYIKICQQVALLLNLGVLKILSAGFWGAIAPLSPTR